MTRPDGLPSGLCPIFAWRNVPCGNPASYLGRFKLFADCVGDTLVLMCMTDKNLVRHRSMIYLIEIVSNTQHMDFRSAGKSRVARDHRSNSGHATRSLAIVHAPVGHIPGASPSRRLSCQKSSAIKPLHLSSITRFLTPDYSMEPANRRQEKFATTGLHSLPKIGDKGKCSVILAYDYDNCRLVANGAAESESAARSGIEESL